MYHFTHCHCEMVQLQIVNVKILIANVIRKFHIIAFKILGFCLLIIVPYCTAVAIGDFLEITASQLTYHGLCELNRIVRDGELCVFFRNNHFNTMLKRNVNHTLYIISPSFFPLFLSIPLQNELLLLVTDFGFLNELGHVWHILSDIDDSGSFLDANFKPFSNHTQPVTQNL